MKLTKRTDLWLLVVIITMIFSAILFTGTGCKDTGDGSSAGPDSTFHFQTYDQWRYSVDSIFSVNIHNLFTNDSIIRNVLIYHSEKLNEIIIRQKRLVLQMDSLKRVLDMSIIDIKIPSIVIRASDDYEQHWSGDTLIVLIPQDDKIRVEWTYSDSAAIEFKLYIQITNSLGGPKIDSYLFNTTISDTITVNQDMMMWVTARFKKQSVYTQEPAESERSNILSIEVISEK